SIPPLVEALNNHVLVAPDEIACCGHQCQHHQGNKHCRGQTSHIHPACCFITPCRCTASCCTTSPCLRRRSCIHLALDLIQRSLSSDAIHNKIGVVLLELLHRIFSEDTKRSL